jgi:hypothetical protein
VNAAEQEALARQLAQGAHCGGLALVVPRQSGDTATRLIEQPAGPAEWAEVVGLIYRRGYRLRPAPQSGHPPLRLVDHDFPDDPA